MRVLVTGASGLVGRALCRRLFELGHSLVVLSRRPDEARAEIGLPGEYLTIRELQSRAPLLPIDGVVHLAGESVAGGRWTAERKRRMWTSRVDGTRELFEVFAQNGVSKPSVFVSASAVGIYGDQGDDELVEASHVPGPLPALDASLKQEGSEFLKSLCVAWEHQASEAAARLGARGVNVRVGVVLSLEGGALAELAPVFQAGAGGPTGSGKQWMSWIHLEDLVSVFVTALTDPRVQGAVNATAPQPVTNREFGQTLGATLGRPAVMPAPAFALKLALGEMASVLLSSQRVLPKALQALGFRFQFETLSQALQDLCGGEASRNADIYTATQWVPQPVEQVFEFFSSEKNLETITPDWLQFQVLGMNTPKIEEGTLIDYRLKLHGVPFRWRTRISSWAPLKFFTDEQVKGPYKSWVHTHYFIPAQGGTLLFDRVYFRLPLGTVGKGVAGGFVRGDVEKIFAYRRKKIGELFPGATP